MDFCSKFRLKLISNSDFFKFTQRTIIQYRRSLFPFSKYGSLWRKRFYIFIPLLNRRFCFSHD